MGAQWKHAGRLENSSKRGALISKLVKEIMVAAKSGDSNPDNNARLRAAVEAAKKASVPRDNIERAIKKGSGQLDGQIIYELVTYEGFAPHKVPVIVECLTENKNRTAADIRVLFRKAQLGSMGSVVWMFDRLGVVEGTHAEKNIDIEGAAIEDLHGHLEGGDGRLEDDADGCLAVCAFDIAVIEPRGRPYGFGSQGYAELLVAFVPELPHEAEQSRFRHADPLGEFLDARMHGIDGRGDDEVGYAPLFFTHAVPGGVDFKQAAFIAH